MDAAADWLKIYQQYPLTKVDYLIFVERSSASLTTNSSNLMRNCLKLEALMVSFNMAKVWKMDQERV